MKTLYMVEGEGWGGGGEPGSNFQLLMLSPNLVISPNSLYGGGGLGMGVGWSWVGPNFQLLMLSTNL